MEEEEEEVRTLLRDAFGESSDSEDAEEAQENESGDPNSRLIFGGSPNWERVSSQIKGLWLCRDLLYPDQQSSLLSAIHKGTLTTLISLYDNVAFSCINVGLFLT